MAKKSNSVEKTEKNNRKNLGGWKKIATIFALASTLGSCDNMPNNEIRLNPEDQSARFKVEYKYSEGSAGFSIVDYDITIHKHGDTYMGLIKEKDGRTGKKTSVESDNIDEIFNEISRALDSERITDNTTNKKNRKVEFVKNEYKNKVLNNKASSNKEIKIKYKSE